MELASHDPEVVVWLPALLDEQSRDRLTRNLESRSGIHSAVFCPIRHHLMLVEYEAGGVSSQDILRYVREGGNDARLVGPI